MKNSAVKVIALLLVCCMLLGLFAFRNSGTNGEDNSGDSLSSSGNKDDNTAKEDVTDEDDDASSDIVDDGEENEEDQSADPEQGDDAVQPETQPIDTEPAETEPQETEKSEDTNNIVNLGAQTDKNDKDEDDKPSSSVDTEEKPENDQPEETEPETQTVETEPEETESEAQPETQPSEDTNSDNVQGEVQPGGSIVTAVGEFIKGVVLVKVEDAFDAAMLGDLAYTSAEALYNGSKWYVVTLLDASKTEDAVTYLTNLGTFEKVDYDYVMGVTAKEEENPDYDKQTNLGLSNIPYGWTQNGKFPGGSSDVVIAVIDTGVDYNHLDLRNNIWINTAEIPNNGKDDDGNGYIDDVYGWDCVGNDNDPMDDNGHGTHVAGIIAAENNKMGGIGVAYNCKVMVLKAGNSSGYFNNSDIAEAIQYAYMNGASVINMSFGGSNISIAVEDALENAYNSCVLVAAAGNDSACNDLSCKTCDIVKVSYPAALPYVIGVMSTDKDGKNISSFSNYDHSPYDSIEYEVYAVGEGVGSTWPSNKYACLNGTSMAAPTVAGIAALLRSYYSDREVYSTKFIQSQIVNTGSVNPYNYLTEETDDAHAVADLQEALTKLPKPQVNLYDYYIDDSISISEANNGNGVIDAGETVRLYISLHNRGGVATNVNVSIDTDRGMGMTDPYFTFVNPTMKLSDIGTYSVRESGEQYFEIVVGTDCPNDYLVDFNIRFTYENGLDSNDKTVYEDDGKQKAQFNVSSGYRLPSIIEEDTIFTNDRLYIVGENVMIPAGVTVTFEEGCRIQFYDDSEYYNSPAITVYGTLNILGQKDNMVSIFPGERYVDFGCIIYVKGSGVLDMEYADTINLLVNDTENTAITEISDSYIRIQDTKYCVISQYAGGEIKNYGASISIDSISHSYIEMTRWNSFYAIEQIDNCYVVMCSDNATRVSDIDQFTNNILAFRFINQSGLEKISFNANSVVTNNVITSLSEDIQALKPIVFGANSTVADNSFSEAYQEYANQVISGYLDANGEPTVDVFGSCSDVSALYPHIVNVEIFNADGEQITTVGKEEITVRVTFNRPMDISVNPGVFFGTIAPYADYKIEGEYVDETVWEGTYTLKAYIENGLQMLLVKGACAAEDATKTVHGENQLYVFNIDTTAAMSMNLFANATDNGIELTWNQDDYDTLMGYNIYRATSKDGNYVKINPSVLLSTDSSFVDENAEPGVTYWYTFTVVLSDFSESAPAGKVFCTAVDTLDPSIYHTPVNQGYQNNNLVISCTASDNMKIASVVLYYRTAGETQWKSITMSKVNDKYSATVFGSELTLDGLEYYIVASDGMNTISKGSAEVPYFVVIKDASVISRIGDVDGDGTVTTKDALMIMQCINGDLIMTDDEFKRADLNGDEVLSSVEALRILQYINGNVSTLDM